MSEHTAEWTLDTPQEHGYVGSRRARSGEDEPAAGPVPWSRPRQATARRPPATWADPEDGTSPGAEVDRWESGSSGQQARWASSSDAWSPPAVDPWSGRRLTEPDPAGQPAVDPWDASGVHAWGRSPVADRWDAAGRWERAEHTGEWDRITDTGEWDRHTDLGQWRESADTGQWSRYAEADQRDRTVPPVEPAGSGSWRHRLEDDLLDPDPGGPVRPLVYTAACYLLPALLVFVGLLFLDGQAPAGCVTDITGGGCDSPRAHAFASLIAGFPRFGLALVSSLVVAAVLRRVGATWRPATLALAAAVVGGGLSTVMISAVSGQPIS